MLIYILRGSNILIEDTNTKFILLILFILAKLKTKDAAKDILEDIPTTCNAFISKLTLVLTKLDVMV